MGVVNNSNKDMVLKEIVASSTWVWSTIVTRIWS